MRAAVSLVLCVSFLATWGVGCSKSSPSSLINDPSFPQTPTLTSPPAGELANGESKILTTSNGTQIVVQKFGKTDFFTVEATFTDDNFELMSRQAAQVPAAERNELLSRYIDRALTKLKNKDAIGLSKIPEVGYFSFLLPHQEDLMAAIKKIKFDNNIIFNPVSYDVDSLKSIHAVRPHAGEIAALTNGRKGTKNYSGLNLIGEPEFVRLAEAAIGEKVNGSSVRLGITDTGITLNHPTFLAANDQDVRIAYMRDFTAEGRIYFNPAAQVTVRQGSSPTDLIISADVIVTPQIPSRPAADAFTRIEDIEIKVSPALHAILTSPNNGNAKFGVLTEDSLQGESDKVDINANKSLNDQILVIWVPGTTPNDDVVYVDTTGRGDFRSSPALGDWNRTRQTLTMFAEKFGFDFRDDQLPKADGSGPAIVRSISVVGFDPGNHGSHVAGIAAGQRTLSNDARNTLARGVAPAATVLMNRVCSNNGGCNATEAFTDLALNAGAEVINMSLGGLGPFNDGYGVQETLINRLTTIKNVLFVISAGNSGPGRQTIGSPSVARLSLSVGAAASSEMIQRQHQWPGVSTSRLNASSNSPFMLFFSSRGPTSAGGFKPNLTAPGTELSSVQLNAAPGSNSALDTYWGTSMSAPTAAGGYALLLDAIKKYNAKNPTKPLTTDAVVLRQVLIETAKPFDVSRFNPETGKKTSGQYTWIDQGTGMLNLPAAWKRLFKLRDQSLPTAVNLAGIPIELDYKIIVPDTMPNGIKYDGSRIGANKEPAFGTGLYLNYTGKDTLRPVYISRELSDKWAGSPDAGALEVQLATSYDEFVLKTFIYGSDKRWIKAGVLDQLNCERSPSANLQVIGHGVGFNQNEKKETEIVRLDANVLNVCLDRNMIANDLAPGDHGALIYAYRTVNNVISAIPSFIVPVYLNVPHKTLNTSTAYEIEGTVASFGLSRNYVTIPAGTSIARITLEVPSLKNEGCSSVELMALEGKNTAKPFASRSSAKVTNCDSDGAPVEDSKRTLVLTRNNPTPGTWDLHVFGSYKFAQSKYKLRVDYITAESSVKEIRGDINALNGNLTWTLQESSLPISPDSGKSSLELQGFFARTESQVHKGNQVVVESPLGALRSYPATAENVVITTGESTGNDIDLVVVECAKTATTVEDPSCVSLKTSGGATDEETVKFKPKTDRTYGVVVVGYDVSGSGAFASTETILMPSENGTAITSGSAPQFNIAYGMTTDLLAASKLLHADLFTSGRYEIMGALTLRAADMTVLSAIPLRIKR